MPRDLSCWSCCMVWDFPGILPSCNGIYLEQDANVSHHGSILCVICSSECAKVMEDSPCFHEGHSWLQAEQLPQSPTSDYHFALFGYCMHPPNFSTFSDGNNFFPFRIWDQWWPGCTETLESLQWIQIYKRSLLSWKRYDCCCDTMASHNRILPNTYRTHWRNVIIAHMAE